jgi:DNA-binding response OmpR family regulator
MNRRILLIDTDHDFYGRLSDLLGRYRLDLVVQADVDEAVSDHATSPPALIIVAVDEPEKAGFKSFQQIKKGPLARVPIVLATRTVSGSAMMKHRSLKTHADEYVDKRTASDDELTGKIDNLIGLGEPAARDSIDIPVEVDDLSVGGDDMVLEETVAADDDHFDHGSKTVAGRSEVVDQMVAAETDAAFDALLGGSFGDEMVPVGEQLGRNDKPTTPPPIGDVEDDPVTIAPPLSESAVAAVAAIDQKFDSEPFDTFSRESERPPIHRAEVSEHVPQAPDEVPTVASEDAEPRSFESSPAIQLDVDDIQQLDDSELSEVIDEEAPDSGGVPEPVPHHNLVSGDEGMALQQEQEAIEAGVPEPVPHHNLVGSDEGREPLPEPAAPAVVIEERAPEPVVHARAESQPPVIAPRAASEPPIASRRANSPAVDLGLDAIAADADREQSGVYDRRALRKIGEMERQITQLKTELERARAETPRGGAGGGREFFALKEQVLAKDTEIRRLTGEVDAKGRELADADERIKSLQQARGDLEARADELEQRLAGDSAKGQALAAKERVLATQLASVQQELETKVQLLAVVEGAKIQLERDLASERATRAASASDAERALRVEREQMIARHQGDLSQLRLEHAGAQAIALEKQRQELAGAQYAAIDAQRAEHEAALDVARKQATSAIEAARSEAIAEAEQAANRKDAAHAAELQRLEQDHAAALARITEERDATVSRTAGEHAAELQRIRGEHATELARAREELEARLAAAAAEASRQVSDVAGELDRIKAELAAAKAAHNEALAQAAGKHAIELAAQADQHAAAMAAREDELLEQRQDEAIAHTAALAELKAELDRQAAAHGLKLDGAKKELDDVLQLHEQAKARLLEDHERAVGERMTAHQAELDKLAEEKQAALDDIARAQAEHARALQAQAGQHEAELASVREAADREVAELKSVLVQAKRAIEEAAARHQAERDAADQAHAGALADQKAQHERALAVLNGEVVKVKAVGEAELARTVAAKDAEHDSAIRAMQSEHARVLKDLTGDRDELQRGLSAARDTIKRSEGELAAAVQTIADRNAELRSHTAAIAERDQRIAELRKEIEGLETENASYQDQVLRAYQKIKSDEAMVARAKKAMAIALTVLDEDAKPKAET